MIKSGSDPKLFTSLKEFGRKEEASILINDTEQENRGNRGRNPYLCIGFLRYTEKIFTLTL